MRRRLALALASLAIPLTAGVVVACSAPDPEARVKPTLPDRAAFTAVAPVLVARCGSLDCHGSQNRNMRLYGLNGHRLGTTCDAPDGGTALPLTRPDSCGKSTQAEIDADYEAVVSVEPEIMSQVAAKKADPGMLTVVRKGRGNEHHKGGQRINPGDDADKCFLGWLRGTPDDASCTRAIQ